MAERELTGVVKPLAKGQITIPVEFRRRLNIGMDTFLQLTHKSVSENSTSTLPAVNCGDGETMVMVRGIPQGGAGSTK